ncbi:MAG: helix-turn-helix domain-containing protein [Ignavibacteria bacterium]
MKIIFTLLMMLKDFGQDLKFIRESKNITIAEISAQTRINTKFIINIESGIFDFQPDTYIRAFLKEYAKAINENENQILTDYEKAKSGFYKAKTPRKEIKPITQKPVIDKEGVPSKQKQQPPAVEKPEPVPEPPPKEILPELTPAQFEPKEEVPVRLEEYSNKTLTQKVLLGLLILIVVASIVYLFYYLNKPDDKHSTVKPKSFNEISDEYETKVKGKTVKDTTPRKDTTTKQISADSLRLTIKAFRDVRIKVHIDENRTVDDMIYSRDSLILTAKEQFRFSASANSSIELYLNGKYLRKPTSLTGTSIKNLVINKNGIVNQ